MSRSRLSSGEAGARSWLPSWLLPRGRRILAGTAVLIVAGAVAIGVTDPFAGKQSGASTTDNGSPTSTATVTRQSLSSQTQVSATLGYAGSYTVSTPSGTAASAVTQASATALADALAVTTDQTALSKANAQLASDQQLGCPAASSATVTTPLSGGGSGGTGSASGAGSGSGSGSSVPSGNTGGSPSGNTGGGPSGNTGNATAHATSPRATSAPTTSAPTTTAPARHQSAPVATTGPASSTTNSSAMLSGTVVADGAPTSYYFEWGTTSPFAHKTAVVNIGPGTAPVSASATLTGLAAGTTYGYRLVATNGLGTSVGVLQTFQTADSSCTAEQAVIATDAAVLSTDQSSAAAAQQALTAAETQAANPGSTFTALPSSGKVVRRGGSVYSVDERPVPLLYGTVTPYRALYLGVSDGPDVTQLQQNLVALGFGSWITPGPHFSLATESEVKAWQASLGVPQSGIVSLGEIVVAPGPIEVNSVTVKLGQAVQAGGAVLTATSRNPVVTINLDASQQSEVKVGDKVSITLPDNSTTPGVVSSIGAVATASSSGGGAGNTGGASSPTIPVLVALTDPAATGGLSQAPVEVAITTGSVTNAFVVPVNALLALASGGYALEEIGAGGSHHLVPVTLGLFDDAAGLVQVTGSGVGAGQHVVVPKA